MLERHSDIANLVGARHRAARERNRALRAAEIADRHERLVTQADPLWRDLHLQMAEIHRDIERRHLAAARVHGETCRLMAAWAKGRAGRSRTPQFMTAVAAAVGARRVGLSLVVADGAEPVTVASDETVTALHELEFTLGEGPVHDVTAAKAPVVVDEVGLARRWPRFARGAARFGVHAVAAAPLRTDVGCLGALTLFDLPADPDRTAEMLCTVADALVRMTLGATGGVDPVVAGASAFAEATSLAVITDEVVHRRRRSS